MTNLNQIDDCLVKAMDALIEQTDDKTFEYRFSDVCAAIRTLPGVSDDEKESVLKEAKLQKEKLRQVVYDILTRNDIEIILNCQF